MKSVITYDFPFSREIIKNGYNGLLARVYDIGNLSDKICLLLEDEQLRFKLGKNAYNYVKEKHNWSTLVDNYIDIYEKLILSYKS